MVSNSGAFSGYLVIKDYNEHANSTIMEKICIKMCHYQRPTEKKGKNNTTLTCLLFTLMLTISTVVLLKYVYLRFTTKRIFLNKEHDYFDLLLMPNKVGL